MYVGSGKAHDLLMLPCGLAARDVRADFGRDFLDEVKHTRLPSVRRGLPQIPPGAAARRIVILAVLRLEDEKIGVALLRNDIAGREKQAAQIALITEQKYKDALVRIEFNRNPALRCRDMKHLSCTGAMAGDNERLAAYINSIYSELPLSAASLQGKMLYRHAWHL